MVWNDSLACCQEKYTSGEKKPINSELQKLFITQAKKTENREWLSEVSAIPLQQSLNDLNRRGAIRQLCVSFPAESLRITIVNAPTNFFKSTKGNRKGRPIKPPKFIVKFR
ncbi:hypothetical protein [Okeania sp. KiyG1]|uniref:hypothetical protein n=1 Tax=Okeania sp. KiyG1 TaxID=2720165 RepID=UPI0019211B6C